MTRVKNKRLRIFQLLVLASAALLPHVQGKDRELVLAHFNEDTSWTLATLNLLDQVSVVTSGPSGCRKMSNKLRCLARENFGCEAGAYLQFIVANYDELAQHTLFMHAHRFAQHNVFNRRNVPAEILVEKHIWDRNLSYVVSHYMAAQGKARRAKLLAPFLDSPNIWEVPGAAQFGVSKARVRQWPHAQWFAWLQAARNATGCHKHSGGKSFGNAWEILWPYVLAPKECTLKNTTHESSCNKRVWFRLPSNSKLKKGGKKITKKELRLMKLNSGFHDPPDLLST